MKGGEGMEPTKERHHGRPRPRLKTNAGWGLAWCRLFMRFMLFTFFVLALETRDAA